MIYIRIYGVVGWGGGGLGDHLMIRKRIPNGGWVWGGGVWGP